MKTFVNLLSAVALLAGIGALVYAFTTPGRYALIEASAIQITQVYAEATLYAVIAVGILLVAVVLQAAGRQP